MMTWNQDRTRNLDGMTVSALGIGTYLGKADEATDRMQEEALIKACESGVNFIDTAVNYRCQRAERAIAYAIRKLGLAGILREQLVIATKGGFLTPDAVPDDFENYIARSYFKTGIMQPEDIIEGCHCMTPSYLSSQVRLSLSNLKLEHIDLYYVHNPEIELPHWGEAEFYRRLTQAFACLEEHVSEKRIGRYGIATWEGLRGMPQTKNSLDLDKVIQSAKDAGGADHHFKAVQLPYNLAMLEAVAIRGQKIDGEDFPILTAAAHHGLAVMISAPLLQGRLTNLSESLLQKLPGTGSAAQKALQFVMSSPGVTSALVGMKTSEHVEENTATLHQEPWSVDDLKQAAEILVRGLSKL